MSNLYIKFGWSLHNGLGGDKRQTDRRTGGGNYNIPYLLIFITVGIISIKGNSRLCKLLRISSFLISAVFKCCRYSAFLENPIFQKYLNLKIDKNNEADFRTEILTWCLWFFSS